MQLSNNLLKEFAQITNDKGTQGASYAYGTVVTQKGATYVKFDGAELLTPVSMAMDAEDGNRVIVMIKNHIATIIGNITSPASAKGVSDITTFYILTDSATRPPDYYDPNWSTNVPDWEDGKFVWQKTITKYESGDISESDPVCLSGAVGASGEDAILLRIDSSRGTMFKNNAVSTILSVIVYYGSQRITTFGELKATLGNGSRLEWEWQRMDEDRFGVLSADDSRIEDGGFRLRLSPNDVDVKCTFRCNLITE